jgi:hypothetical protein
MKDPVFTSDGQTYEREVIETWLSNHQTSPYTNMTLPDKVLRPNIALRKTINTFLERHPEFLDEVYFSETLEKLFIGACRTMNEDAITEAQAIDVVKQLILSEKRFLSHRFQNGGTVLHIVAQLSAFGTLKTVFESWESFQKGRSNPILLKDALIEPDNLGLTPLVRTISFTI